MLLVQGKDTPIASPCTACQRADLQEHVDQAWCKCGEKLSFLEIPEPNPFNQCRKGRAVGGAFKIVPVFGCANFLCKFLSGCPSVVWIGFGFEPQVLLDGWANCSNQIKPPKLKGSSCSWLLGLDQSPCHDSTQFSAAGHGWPGADRLRPQQHVGSLAT